MANPYWEVEKTEDGRFRVVGRESVASSASGDVPGPVTEVYYFDTLEWAQACEATMERLSHDANYYLGRGYYTYISGSSIAFRGISDGSYVSSVDLVAAVLAELTPAKLLARWTAPMREKAKSAFNKLMWGENGASSKEAK